jgi:ectoine hydroxylase-related dioxygenase (phytanoyl-CoA dioxygenase family)
MNRCITDYNQYGYLSPLKAFTYTEAQDTLRKLEFFENKLGHNLFLKYQIKGHLIFPFLWDIVHDKRIIKIVESIIGDNILCWGSSLFIKDASSYNHVPWHQDGTCWGLNGDKGLTVWLALTPSKKANGCLRILPSSHTKREDHIINNDSTSMLPLNEQINGEVDEGIIKYCELNPGEMSIHHMYSKHSSCQNQSTHQKRMGFAIRYISGEMTNKNKSKSYVTLVKGSTHNFNLELPPSIDLDKDALRRHKHILSVSERIVRNEASELDSILCRHN